MELHSIYGGSLAIVRARDERSRPKLNYQLVQREAVFAMLQDMIPFLIEKRVQVELILQKYRAGMSLHEGQSLKEQLSDMKRRTFDEPLTKRRTNNCGES